MQLETAAAAAALKLAVTSTTSLELKRPTASFIFKLQELRSSIHLARGGSDAHLAAETEVRPERLRLARPSFLFLNRNTRVEKINNKHNVQRVNLAVKSNSHSGNLQRTSVRWKPKNDDSQQLDHVPRNDRDLDQIRKINQGGEVQYCVNAALIMCTKFT